MKFEGRHWAIALLAAAFLQLALAVAIYRPYQPHGAGFSGGVEIELGPSLASVTGAEKTRTAATSGEARQFLPAVQPQSNSDDLTEPDFEETTALSKEAEHKAAASAALPIEGAITPAVTPLVQPKARPKLATNTKASTPLEKKRHQSAVQNTLPPRTEVAESTDTNQQVRAESTAWTSSKKGDHDGATTTASSAHAANTSHSSGTAATVSAAYYHRLAAWLEKHKRYPRRAVQRRQQGVVKVSFKIDRQGNLLSREIVASSGFRLLDEAADALLLRASPMPGIPRQSTAQVLEFTVPIMYALR